MIDSLGIPLWANLLIFAAAGIVVWFAGSRLAVAADGLVGRTSLEHAFVGGVLLAGATELPELVTSITAAGLGNAPLAVNKPLRRHCASDGRPGGR